MVYKIIAKFYPPAFRNNVSNLMKYSDMKVDKDYFVGFMIFFSLSTGLLLSFVLNLFFGYTLLYSAIVFLVTSVLLQGALYFYLIFRADKKAKFIEEVLPDALQLIASNLKAGLPVEKAVLTSVRHELGPLATELSIVGREIATGKSFEYAILDMTKRVRSEKLSRTASLIVYGMRSGGKLALLLTQTAQNLRNQAQMEERIRASVLMYSIFILSALVFATPIIFALSALLSKVVITQLSQIEIPSGVALPLTFGVPVISEGFILGYIISVIVMLDIFGGIIIGLISKGRGTEGVKYIPVLILLSLGLFFLVRLAFGGIFSGF